MLTNSKILLNHGSGGKLMYELIEQLLKNKFSNEILDVLDVSAVIDLSSQHRKLCFTTDSYVVNPLFFRGGDIGKLAICGTINDLVVVGAIPYYISCGLIIEEGLEYKILEKIINSMAELSHQEKIKIVSGDIKVVEKSGLDKLFINTSGIGFKNYKPCLSKKMIKTGDKIITSGTIGEHEIAVLEARGNFNFETKIYSDCAPLTSLVAKIFKVSNKIKFMRDPTRGGLATTLNEIVKDTNFGILIDEEKIPIKEEIKSICEILGFDPLYLANEGKVVIIVSANDAYKVVGEMRRHPLGKKSSIIGEIIENPKQKVIMKTKIKGIRMVEMLTGYQLPRIC